MLQHTARNEADRDITKLKSLRFFAEVYMRNYGYTYINTENRRIRTAAYSDLHVQRKGLLHKPNGRGPHSCTAQPDTG